MLKESKTLGNTQDRLASSSAVKIIPRAFSCISFCLRSFNFSSTERPANSNGWTMTGFNSTGGRSFQTSSTKFMDVCTNCCPFLTKARSHFCAVSIDMHQGSIPMAAFSGRFCERKRAHIITTKMISREQEMCIFKTIHKGVLFNHKTL